MSDTKGAGALLLVAADPALRESLAALLEPRFAVLRVRPEQLADRVRWLDAPAAVAVLDGRDGEQGLARLLPLGELPAGRGLVLVTREVPEERLESALLRLGPGQLLGHPVCGAALRFAVARVLPPQPVGEGARDGQRRAPALLGVSAAIREVLEQVRRIASSPVTVLILGETGTGKELVARSVHDQGGRHGAPFVPVNCGALPEALLESELFGFERGAFTGAQRDKPGLFEQAHGGTLFLDEVGDMSPALQVKLLRAIESGEVRRVGSTKVRRVEVRILSATHRDLEAAVEEGSFRRDLLYRLNTLTLYVPPLRRRRVDIPFLAQHFAEEFGAAHARRVTLADDFLEALTQHDFPGNVRELRNAVERAIALAAPGEPVSARHLPPTLRRERAAPPARAEGSLRQRLQDVEIQAIRDALQRFEGNRTRAAEHLGLSRLGLRQKMRRLGLEEPSGR